jgi:hypothetical protein
VSLTVTFRTQSVGRIQIVVETSDKPLAVLQLDGRGQIPRPPGGMVVRTVHKRFMTFLGSLSVMASQPQPGPYAPP